MLDKLIQADINLFIWLNSWHNDFFDPVMKFISGKMEWAPLYLILLGITIYKYRWKSIWIIVAVVIAITLADTISSKVFKVCFERLRPSHNPDLEGIIHLVDDYKGGLYGFVSGHAANSFCLAVFFALLFRNRIFQAFILLWAVIVSYSRIYLGVHYPADILGGALLGSLVALGIYYFYQYLDRKFNQSTPN